MSLTLYRHVDPDAIATLNWMAFGTHVVYCVNLHEAPRAFFNIETADLAEVLYAHP